MPNAEKDAIRPTWHRTVGVVTWCSEHGSLPERFRYKGCPWCPSVLAEEVR